LEISPGEDTEKNKMKQVEKPAGPNKKEINLLTSFPLTLI